MNKENAKHTKQPIKVYRDYSKAEKLQGNSPSGNSLAQDPLKSEKWLVPMTLKVF